MLIGIGGSGGGEGLWREEAMVVRAGRWIGGGIWGRG